MLKHRHFRELIGSLGASAAQNDVTSADTMMAYVKQVVRGQGVWTPGTTDTSPLASMDLWSITGGPVMVHEIFGVVTTTAIQAQATTVQLKLDPDDGGSDVALDAGSLDATGDVTGTIYRWTKDFSEALIALLDASEATDIQAPGVILQPGDIKVVYGAASTGQINWFCKWSAIGAGVLAAG